MPGKLSDILTHAIFILLFPPLMTFPVRSGSAHDRTAPTPCRRSSA